MPIHKNLKYKPSTFGFFLFNQAFNGILCLKPNPFSGKWSIPKGRKADGDKDEYETAARELFEEAGINIKKEKVLHAQVLGTFPYACAEGKSLWATFLVINNKDIKVFLNKENTKFEWMPFEAATKKLHEAQVRALFAIKHKEF